MVVALWHLSICLYYQRILPTLILRTTELKTIIHLKHKHFIKAKYSHSNSAWLHYKQLLNKVKNSTKTAYWNYVNNLFATEDNKRSFWCFVRDQRKIKFTLINPGHLEGVSFPFFSFFIYACIFLPQIVLLVLSPVILFIFKCGHNVCSCLIV